MGCTRNEGRNEGRKNSVILCCNVCWLFACRATRCYSAIMVGAVLLAVELHITTCHMGGAATSWATVRDDSRATSQGQRGKSQGTNSPNGKRGGAWVANRRCDGTTNPSNDMRGRAEHRGRWCTLHRAGSHHLRRLVAPLWHVYPFPTREKDKTCLTTI